MIERHRQRLVSFIMIFLCLVQGCKSMYPIDADVPDRIVEQVQVGDVVRIHTKQGVKIKTKVISISNEKISGKNVEIAMQEVASIEVRKHDPEKVGLITLGAIAGGGIVIAVVVAVIKSLLGD